MTSLVRIGSVALLGLVLSLPSPARAAESKDLVKITVQAGKIAEDGTQVVTITLEIDKGWSLFANPSGQEVLKSAETKVQVSSTQKLEIVKVAYPPGKVIKDADLGDYYIYEGNITINATVKREKGATDPVELVVRVRAINDRQCVLSSKVNVTAK